MAFQFQDQLPDQLVVLNPKQLQDFIYSSIQSSLSKLLASKDQQPTVQPQKIWRTRKEVAKLLHITYPTLQKHTDSGLLKCDRIGRRVLYDDAQLCADIPLLQNILKKRTLQHNRIGCRNAFCTSQKNQTGKSGK